MAENWKIERLMGKLEEQPFGNEGNQEKRKNGDDVDNKMEKRK